MKDLKLSDFDFDYPNELIALNPLEKRDQAKMLVVDKKKQTITHSIVSNLPEFFSKRDLIVRNNTKVFPARLIGKKKLSRGKVEIFLVRKVPLKVESRSSWLCMINMSKKVQPETLIEIEGGFEATIKETNIDLIGSTPIHLVEFLIPQNVFLKEISKIGKTPLPPYIKRQENAFDKESYQTIYAKNVGAVAAPTAGLHFTTELTNNILKKEAQILDITLHVGPGTFVPVSCDEIKNHSMHSEEFFIPEPNFKKISTHLDQKKPVTAIGTTCVRTLETAFPKGKLEGNSSLFIYPGYEFKTVSKLLTNFHLPKSTLFMLISAFIGDIDFAKKCYEEAFRKEYRLFSYGDAMLII